VKKMRQSEDLRTGFAVSTKSEAGHAMQSEVADGGLSWPRA